MKSFIKIQVGHTVFDSAQKLSGSVLSIDHSTNEARVSTNDLPKGERIVYCKLANLIVLGENDKMTETKGLDTAFELVKEFHEAFEHPVADEPTKLSPNRAVSRSIWTAEEIVELLQSSVMNESEFLHLYNQLLEGMEKAKQKSLADGFPVTNKQKLVAQSDALVDTLYFILGSFVEMNVKPNNLFNIVQSANMSKLFTAEDGTKYAKYRESDGKIMKSPEFFEPEPLLKEEIERQSKK